MKAVADISGEEACACPFQPASATQTNLHGSHADLALLIISLLIYLHLMMIEARKPFALMLHEVSRLVRSRIEARVGRHGLSEAQLRLLMRLWKEEGATQARLAESLEVEPISISRLLDRMEQGGWIERRQDARDRRVRKIFTTEKTRDIRGAVKDTAAQVVEEALAGVPAETRDIIYNGLETMARNLGGAVDLTGACSSSNDRQPREAGVEVSHEQ